MKMAPGGIERGNSSSINGSIPIEGDFDLILLEWNHFFDDADSVHAETFLWKPLI